MSKIETLKRTISLCPECFKNIRAEIVWDKNEKKIDMYGIKMKEKKF